MAIIGLSLLVILGLVLGDVSSLAVVPIEYHDFTALEDFLLNIRTTYPDITRQYSIGKSVQGEWAMVLNYSKSVQGEWAMVLNYSKSVQGEWAMVLNYPFHLN